jgi:protein SCO1/2
MKKIITSIVIIGLAALFLFKGLLNYKSNKASKILPYYGNKDLASNGKDTIYHYVPDFKFINQEGKTITQKNLDGSVYVADYFFTTCQSICPIMSNEMELLAKHFEGNSQVKFISHTVNPENDSVPVLADYAKAHHANPNQWYLVTGDKKQLYELARKGYFLNTEDGDGGPNDFIHTQNFALVDKYKHIRGFYDGTNHKEMENLIEDIEILLKEY